MSSEWLDPEEWIDAVSDTIVQSSNSDSESKSIEVQTASDSGPRKIHFLKETEDILKITEKRKNHVPTSLDCLFFFGNKAGLFAGGNGAG